MSPCVAPFQERAFCRLIKSLAQGTLRLQYLVVDDELEELTDPQPHTLVLRLCQGYEMFEDILHASHVTSVGEMRNAEGQLFQLERCCLHSVLRMYEGEPTSTNVSPASWRPDGRWDVKVATKRTARSTCVLLCDRSSQIFIFV